MVEKNKKTQEISGRINQIRQYFCNGVNGEFASKIGKEPSYTSQLCTGTKSIGSKVIDKILDTFPEVNRTWLILGEGEMLNTPASVTQTVSGTAPAINNNGNHNTNTINMDDNTSLINEIIKGKDEQIQTLKDTIKALSGEVEQLRNYVSLTSSKYINVIERMLYTTNETNEIVKQATAKIGFKQCQEKEE